MPFYYYILNTIIEITLLKLLSSNFILLVPVSFHQTLKEKINRIRGLNNLQKREISIDLIALGEDY